MAGWSEAQRYRLGTEKDILEQYFSKNVEWIEPTNPSKSRVEVKLQSNSNKKYTLRVYLKEDFPNSCPHMAIVQPRNLRSKNNLEIPLMDKSFHTLGLTVDGFTKLCHYSPELWTSDITLYNVFMKGRLWIEAYEGHLETGNPMDTYLGEQQGAEPNVDQNAPEQVPEKDDESSYKKEQSKSSCCLS